MDYLWTPWRYSYITEPGARKECVFCAAAGCSIDRAALVVHRAERNFIIVNRFPYTSGHVMVVPYQHAPSLEDLPGETLAEMMLLARDCEKRIRALYRQALERDLSGGLAYEATTVYPIADTEGRIASFR